MMDPIKHAKKSLDAAEEAVAMCKTLLAEKQALRKENAALLAEAERQRWQPIGTHDKSRRAVLVWCPKHRNIYEVCWDDSKFLGDSGWFHFSGLGDRLREIPTHWMPLPPPPAPRQATGEEGA